ncbi:MAG: hypothetical protein V5A56_13025 [Halolamina sp.]
MIRDTKTDQGFDSTAAFALLGDSTRVVGAVDEGTYAEGDTIEPVGIGVDSPERLRLPAGRRCRPRARGAPPAAHGTHGDAVRPASGSRGEP